MSYQALDLGTHVIDSSHHEDEIAAIGPFHAESPLTCAGEGRTATTGDADGANVGERERDPRRQDPVVDPPCRLEDQLGCAHAQAPADVVPAARGLEIGRKVDHRAHRPRSRRPSALQLVRQWCGPNLRRERSTQAAADTITSATTPARSAST